MLKSVKALLEDNKDMKPSHIAGHKDLTCGWACLEMLSTYSFTHSGHETSSGMDPFDMEIMATFCQLHLIPLSTYQTATSSLDEGTYLVLGRRNGIPHWFILHLESDVANVYDPAENFVLDFSHHGLPPAYCEGIITIYHVINCDTL